MSKIKEMFTKDKVIIAILLSTLILVNGIFLFLIFSFQLNGNKKVVLNYNEEYVEKGTKFFGSKVDNVKISGEVDTSKLGCYELTYEYKFGPFHFSVKRNVDVVDNEAPVINLKGSEKIDACLSGIYKEDGYEAIDNYDGDVTDKVEVKKEENRIAYTVVDNAGNKTTVYRETSTKDETAPKIALAGGNTISVTKGYKYIEKGYNVTDNCDTDLNSKVVVSGTVDTSKIGSYELTYEVEDSSGNKATAKRTVKVVEYVAPVKDTSPGVIYLTFDDGPSGSGSTAKILDVLKKYNVKATFFVTGSGPDSLIVREHNEGHTVALHTYTHTYKTVYADVDGYFNDLQKVHDRVERLTGVDSRITRFPGGSNNTVSNSVNKGIMKVLREEVVTRGYNYFDWNVDASDAWSCTKSTVKDKKACVYNNVTKSLSKKRRNVVLMHDIKSYTADALEDIIKFAIANNYSFEVLTYETQPVRFA